MNSATCWRLPIEFYTKLLVWFYGLLLGAEPCPACVYNKLLSGPRRYKPVCDVYCIYVSLIRFPFLYINKYDTQIGTMVIIYIACWNVVDKVIEKVDNCYLILHSWYFCSEQEAVLLSPRTNIIVCRNKQLMYGKRKHVILEGIIWT